MLKKTCQLIFALVLLLPYLAHAEPLIQGEDGYRLWLKYDSLTDESLKKNYRQTLRSIHVPHSSDTNKVLLKEWQHAYANLLDTHLPLSDKVQQASLVIGTPDTSEFIKQS